jgi:hypothetical protein
MYKFELDYKLHKNLNLEISGLELIDLSDKELVLIYKKDLEFLIDSFNKRFIWDDMFNFEDVIGRIKNGIILFMLYYESKPIGYVFYESKQDGEYYLYNLFVKKSLDRPKLSPVWFVNKTISMLPNDCKKITCYCEEWHKSAQNVFLQNNFVQNI